MSDKCYRQKKWEKSMAKRSIRPQCLLCSSLNTRPVTKCAPDDSFAWSALPSSVLMVNSPWFKQHLLSEAQHMENPTLPSCPLLSFPCRSNIWYKLLICIFNICLFQLECKFQEGRALCFVQGYNSKPWIVPDKK